MKSRINLSTFLGLIAAFCVIWFGVIAGNSRKEIFLDSHALILVLGGTFAAALIAFPLSQFRDLWTFFSMGALFPPEKGFTKTISHLMILSSRPLLANVDATIRETFHPFLLEGYTLMRKQEWDPGEFRLLLHGRNQRFKERYSLDAKALTALAKFPPAFGLLGATTGMIAMMTHLGAAGKDSIGPAMAIALVATFWGIALANLIILPLADHCTRLNQEDARLRLMIATGLALIHQGHRPSAVFEHLIGFLPVSERSNPTLHHALMAAESDSKRDESHIKLTGTGS
jgi:chemotaxis protein MotA